jgi:DNA-binding SARP family transcriptional activator
MALLGIGDLFVDIDALEAASAAYAQARQPVERIKDLFLRMYLDLAEAAASRLKGDLPQAHLLLETAQHWVLQMRSNYLRGLFLMESARLALAEKRSVEAGVFTSEAAAIFENGGQRVNAARALLLHACSCLEAGDQQAALQNLERALQLASALGNSFILAASARCTKTLLELPGIPPPAGQQAQQLLELVQQFESSIPRLKRSLRFQKAAISLAPPRLRIQSLGAAQVWLDEKLLTSADWQTQTTRDLLFLILSRDQGWSKEALGEILWRESSPAQLKNRFKNTIYRLRRALQQDVIVFDGERYAFNWELDYEYDVERFTEALARASQAADEPARSNAYQEALRLYHGEYLPDAAGSWIMPERQRLRQAFHTAGLELARALLDSARYEQALETSTRLIADDACLEPAVCLAMQAQAALGKKAEAIHLHESLVEALAALDTSPSPQTEALFRSILR